jgi:hypothetical protein
MTTIMLGNRKSEFVAFKTLVQLYGLPDQERLIRAVNEGLDLYWIASQLLKRPELDEFDHVWETARKEYEQNEWDARREYEQGVRDAQDAGAEYEYACRTKGLACRRMCVVEFMRLYSRYAITEEEA